MSSIQDAAAERATHHAPPPNLDFKVSSPEVSILIVGYKSKAFIADCIASVFERTRVPFEVLFIDNSDDGSANLVGALFPSVRVAPSAGNVGFGPGNNRLARLARADRLLLLNPDTEVTDGAIDRLVAFSKSRPDAGAWGGLTVAPDGVPDAGNRMSVPTLGRLARWTLGRGRALEEGGLADMSRPGPVDVLPGGFMMLRRDVWDELGGFDETFFLYSEEVDLFVRLKRAGHLALATPDAVVLHDAGSGERMSPQRLHFRTKGLAHYVRKHWRGAKALLALSLLWLGFSWRWLASAALGTAPRAQGWRAKRRAYGPLVLAPWRWWRGYAP